jgi:hypothetical protein
MFWRRTSKNWLTIYLRENERTLASCLLTSAPRGPQSNLHSYFLGQCQPRRSHLTPMVRFVLIGLDPKRKCFLFVLTRLAESPLLADLARRAKYMGLSNCLKRARQRLFGALRKLLPKSTKVATAHGEYNRLSRFIFDKKHFSVLERLPKPAAFIDPTLRMSAMGIDDLRDPDIWSLGDMVGAPRRKPALARADFGKSDVQTLQLTVEPDPSFHPRHVEICGWPSEKDERIALALELCVKSLLFLRES